MARTLGGTLRQLLDGGAQEEPGRRVTITLARLHGLALEGEQPQREYACELERERLGLDGTRTSTRAGGSARTIDGAIRSAAKNWKRGTGEDLLAGKARS